LDVGGGHLRRREGELLGEGAQRGVCRESGALRQSRAIAATKTVALLVREVADLGTEVP
jgi:hypothetical protein